MLLNEVPGLGQFERRGTAADHGRERMHHRRAEHRVLHADRHERLSRPAVAEEAGRPLRSLDAVHLRIHGHEGREAADAGAVTGVRERRVIGGGLGVREPRHRALHQRADTEIRIRGDEGLPGVEAGTRRAADAEAGVHDDQAVDALGELHRQREAQESAPVLHHQRHPLEAERLDEPHEHPAVEAERIGGVVHGLVGATEAEEVGRHDAVPGRREDRDHLAVKVAPGRLAVQAQHGAAARRARGRLVEIVDAQRLVARQLLEVVRREIEPRQAFEPIVGSAQRLHCRGHGRDPGGTTQAAAGRS